MHPMSMWSPANSTEPTDTPLSIPLRRTISWATVYRLSQSAPAAASPLLSGIRDTATIQRGTRMVKVLSGRQLSGYLRGRLPYGFCHREYDIAHLRTPADLAVLRTDGGEDIAGDVAFALRWRAVDPADYAVPSRSAYDGLVRISPHDRLGAPVLGTGFAPSRVHIIPEWITADLVDLPLPARAELIAFTADGTEVLLYRYLAEQRAWARLAGPQWRQHVGRGRRGRRRPGVFPGRRAADAPGRRVPRRRVRSDRRPARRVLAPGEGASAPASDRVAGAAYAARIVARRDVLGGPGQRRLAARTPDAAEPGGPECAWARRVSNAGCTRPGHRAPKSTAAAISSSATRRPPPSRLVGNSEVRLLCLPPSGVNVVRWTSNR